MIGRRNHSTQLFFPLDYYQQLMDAGSAIHSDHFTLLGVSVSKTFLIISLIVCCIVIFLARDLLTAGLIIAMIVNFALIWRSFADEPVNAPSEVGPAAAKMSPDMSAPNDATTQVPDAPTWDLSTSRPRGESGVTSPADMYGPFYDMWHQNRAAYTDCYPERRAPEVAMMSDDVDSGVAMIGIERARDKKCIDAWVARDANYYKQHFGSEFEESEARPWWGRHEY